ncbi:MAG: Bcr/CflA family multidrug efflux MFS transporter [Alphaproteobacteria bacterium]|nr:Bcr/CflA family multidrug efflux MFS transporter [Alphaproteobacteria bacterium]MBU0798779.1 Bcr/CflA family multidrug efflux MFS transporter [Alphaproteobacteria bacterium]MBU0886042.1 Bcr/CflA family multidrug efflux MFS transporter [Alphaproteobacteria bacterium]MBU1812031.1 Bcr/CflA family multidrug efflux MFS transporter [Alphaproteobacteria bacterium]
MPSALRLALILGALTAFAPMSIDMYLPAFPAMQQDFATNAGHVQLTLSVFLLGLSLGQIFYGPLADRYGRKPPLYVGIALYTVASVAIALSTTIDSLILLRFAQALGGCSGMVIARAMVRDLFDERGSAKMYAQLMLVMGAAPILAPILGGYVLLVANWHAIFWILAVFGGACLTAVVFALPESLPAERRGAGGLGPALVNYGFLLRSPAFLAFAMTGGCIQAGMFAYITGSPFVFIDLYKVPAEQYGYLFGLNALGLIASSQINHRLLSRYSGRQILNTAVPVIATAALVLAALAATGTGGLLGIVVPLFFCIAGMGFVGPNALAAAMAPHGRIAGSASALLGVLQFGTGAMAGTIVGLLNDGSARPMAFTIAGLACCAAALRFFVLPRFNRPA